MVLYIEVCLLCIRYMMALYVEVCLLGVCEVVMVCCV